MSVARHTAYNLIGAVVPLAVSLVTVPLYLKVIGLDRYGLLAICWLLVGYFNLFDFGLGRATAQKIATLAEADPEERSRIFWTSAALSSALVLAAMLAFYPLARFGLRLMNLPDVELRQEVDGSLLLLLAAVPFGIAQSLLAGSLEGRRDFLKLNVIISTASVLTAVLPLLTALWIDARLPSLLAASLVSRAFVLLLLMLVCYRAVPLHKPVIASIGDTRALLHFGGWTTITNVFGSLISFVDRFAIGTLLGTAAVALYVVPFNLIGQLVVLPAAFAGALFPKLASLSAAHARAMMQSAMRVIVFLLTPATLVMLLFAGPFLHLWIGDAAAQRSTPVAYALIFGFWANSLGRMAFARLQAGGRPDLIAAVHLAEIIPYLGLLYWGMVAFGLAGAAMAWSIRCAADALILMLIDKTNRSVLRLLFVHGLIVSAAIAVMLTTPTGSLVHWLFVGVIAATTIVLLGMTRPTQIVDLLSRLRPANRIQTGAP